jgi:photosystem II stability/assembly factor-like uncharacterized protein
MDDPPGADDNRMSQRPSMRSMRAAPLRGACALAVVIACATSMGAANGASSEPVVTANVPSATTLVVTGCASENPGVTMFGVVQPGSVSMTPNDCTVTFGSSNDTSSLRVSQADGLDTAMARPSDAWTRHTGGSTRMVDIDRSGGTAVALRSNGNVYRSTDGGASWTAITTSGGSVDSTISLATTQDAWVTTTGPTVQRGANVTSGPVTWSATATNPGMASTLGVTASSNLVAWVVGSGGGIASTINGGASWTTHASPTTAALTGISRLDANSLVTWGGNGLVVATSNGTTWRDITIPGGPTINSVWPLSDDAMVAVTSGGGIYTTANATNVTPTWTQREATTHLSIEDVAFQSASNGIAVGHDGVMLTTTNGGTTWARDDLDTSLTGHAITTTAAGAYVVASAGTGILRTTDSGANWASVLAGWRPSLFDVAMTTDARGWAVGSDGTVQRTTTAGTTWTPQTSSTTADLFGVHAFDPLRAVAVGRDGTVVSTSDAGVTWTVRASGVVVDLRAIDGTTTGTAWAVGENGTIIRTDDHGTSWRTQSTAANVSLLTVAVVDGTRAVAFGQGGAYRTSNGTSWSSIVLPTGASGVRASTALRDTSTIGYSAAGYFVRSTDAGATWSLVSPPGTIYPNGMSFVTPSRIVAISMNSLQHSTDGGATWSNAASSQITFHWGYGVAAVERSKVVVVGDGEMTGSSGSADPVADYALGSSDWYNDGTEAFGMCLRATSATPTWTPNATCDQSADGAHWRGIPIDTSLASQVASLASGTATAQFRFGLRVAPDQPAGELSAGIAFTLVAPGT